MPIVIVVNLFGTGVAELKIREYCKASENENYSFIQLFFLLIKNIFQINDIPDASKQSVICSEFVARAFRSGGIDLCPGIDPEDTTPADIAKSKER